MFAETMRALHEEAYADRMHAITIRRNDEYGIGYLMVRDYILNQSGQSSYMPPFLAMIQLLKDIIDGKVTIQ